MCIVTFSPRKRGYALAMNCDEQLSRVAGLPPSKNDRRMRGVGSFRTRRRDLQWISSGFDEPTVQRVRSRTFCAALKQKSAGSLGWLRRLHRSHLPQAVPFSTCMHRTDAATVTSAHGLPEAVGFLQTNLRASA